MFILYLLVHAGNATRCHASCPCAYCTCAASATGTIVYLMFICTWTTCIFLMLWLPWRMQEVPERAMPTAPMPTAPVQQDFFRLLHFDLHHSFYIQSLSITNLQHFHVFICRCMQEVQQGAMPAAIVPTAHVQQAQQERYIYIYMYALVQTCNFLMLWLPWCTQEEPQRAMPAAPMPTAQDALYLYWFPQFLLMFMENTFQLLKWKQGSRNLTRVF